MGIEFSGEIFLVDRNIPGVMATETKQKELHYVSSKNAVGADRISGGRFILGLGSSAPTWTRDIFGTSDYKPIAHLRDTVGACAILSPGRIKGLSPMRAVTSRLASRS
jgi:hypothetical protein